jgi:hypothetical protein
MKESPTPIELVLITAVLVAVVLVVLSLWFKI